MKKSNIKNNIGFILAALAVIAAVFLRQVDFRLGGSIGWICSIICVLIYIGLFSAWGFSLWYRVVQKRVREYLIGVAALMICWMVVRTLKYWLPLPASHLLIRTLWYCYYIFILALPMLFLLISFYLGKPEPYSQPKWMRFLFIPTTILTFLVLTNDLHQLVFTFPVDSAWSDLNYTYGQLYWLVICWVLICSLASITTLFIKCRVPHSKKYYLLPLLPFFAVILYCVCYIERPQLLKTFAGDMTSFVCLLIMTTLEICIRCRLIQSNTHYDELFRSAGVQAKITDKEYNVLLSSVDTVPLTKEAMRQTEKAPVLLDGGVRLCGAPIKDGYVLWSEDMSDIYSLLSRLQDVNDRLSEDNDLLEAENEMRKRQAKVAEKDRLYDKVTREVLPQFQALDELLSGNTELSSREKLRKLCVYGTYIKRRCNLLIIREDMTSCAARELEYCLRETCEALSAVGVDCSFHRNCAGEMPIQTAVLLYDMVEELLETMLPSLTSLFLKATLEDGLAEIKLLADHTQPLSTCFKNAVQLNDIGGALSLKQEDGATSAVLRIPKGGEAV